MRWQYTPLMIPLASASVLSSAIAFFAWRRRRVPGAIPLVVLALAAAIWSAGYASELSSADLPTGLFWAKVQYLGICALPGAWLAFALQYTNHHQWLNRHTSLLFALMPLVTLLLAWTNEQHLLIWRATSLSKGDTAAVLHLTHGPWFWGYIVYSYLCLFAGAVLLVRALISAPQLYRGQAVALVIGIVAPWVGNGLYIARLSPWPDLDLTPFGFTLASLAVAWSLARFRLLDLVPIARDLVIDSMSDGVLVLDEQRRVVDLNRAARQVLGYTTTDVIGWPAAQVFAHQAHLIERYRDTAELVEELEVGEGATRRVFELRLAPLADRRGRHSGRLIVWRDITERKQLEAALQRHYQRAVAARERLTMLYQAAQALSRASLDPDQVYAELHRATARLMRCEVFAITLIDTARQEAEEVYMADPAGPRPGRRYPLANSFGGSTLCRNASLRIDDVGAVPPAELAAELLGNQPDSGSGMAVLLQGSEQIIGMVFVQSDDRGAYGDEDEEALKLLAAQAAIALENAHRYQQARELAASEERTRLARELHDSVTQTLYAASLLTESLPIVWQRNVAEGSRTMVKLRQLVRGALAEMRTLLFELRPAALAAANLGTLLKQLGDVLTGHTRVPVDLTVEGQAQLPASVTTALYRIAQEAFNNIAKHAGATRVGVIFQVAPGRLFLSVRDDGQGFDPDAVPADRMGLQIMAERAAGIGAQLRIDSALRRGTEITVVWIERGS